MYYCLNVVTERIGYPAAMLIRAVDIAQSPITLIDGPGRVCRLFQIDRHLNGWDLTCGRTLWLEDRGVRIPASDVLTAPRIGVDYAGECAANPWRFRYKKAPRQKGTIQH
jgi:DNA-3-methyladenine glycosylase